MIIGSLTAFTVYVSDNYPPDNTALKALSSSEYYNVVNTKNCIIFTPLTNKSTIGIIFYPGAKVQPESYSVLASKLAQKGYTTIIVKMPFNLAFFGADEADEIIDQHNDIITWVIGGHSLGGVFASDYAVNHSDKIKGIIYLAAYPNINASKTLLKALSIRGSQDGLTKEEDISKNLNK